MKDDAFTLSAYLPVLKGADPDALTEITVYLTIDRTEFGYWTDNEQITLQYNDAGIHRGRLRL